MHTNDLVEENIEKIGKLFPNAITERQTKEGTKLAVDFEILQQELSDILVDGRKERYHLEWPGKRQAILEANAPVSGTLRPFTDESVNFEKTKNLYIEGNNLDVLKLLQEAYLGAIKVIYIDPPYNRGKDAIYKDDYKKDTETYLKESGQYNNQGEKLVQNFETNGRFHTDWLNFMYPRLKIARDLLSKDGVIFVSIDDHEQENLKKIMCEIFGGNNFIAQVVWERAYSPVNLKKHFSESHDYILCFAKNKSLAKCNGLPRTQDADERYENPDNDSRGPWSSSDLSVGPVVQSKVYEIKTPSGRKVLPPNGYCWRLDKDTFQQYVNDNRIWFGENGSNVPRIKRFLSEVKQGITPMTIWKYEDVGHSQGATQSLKELFDSKAVFDYPKPVELIKRCIQLYSDKDSIVMDFFAGSSTTAHAVMQLNVDDSGERQYIMVQLPEICDPTSEACKDGYKNICEIGKERIRRAVKKIEEEHPDAKFDAGFRVLKLDSSNMKDVYYKPNEYSQEQMDMFVGNIKEDRTAEDLLFQVMLELGALPSSKIDVAKIAGKKVFSVADNYLLACFDSDISEEVVKAIAKKKPVYAVLRDSSFANDAVATNYKQIFKTFSPDTEIRVF